MCLNPILPVSDGAGRRKKKEGPWALRELKGVTEEGCWMRTDGGGNRGMAGCEAASKL